MMSVRGLSSVDVETRRLGYTEYGDPARVVSLVTERIEADLRPGQVIRVHSNEWSRDFIPRSSLNTSCLLSTRPISMCYKVRKIK